MFQYSHYDGGTTLVKIPHPRLFQSIVGSIALISSVLFVEIAWSQARIVKVVVPYPPGGVNEIRGPGHG